MTPSPTPARARLYDAAFVRGLFDGMAATYGAMNLVSSFGFCDVWRRQCVAAARIVPGEVVLDLMSGMGECWPLVARRLDGRGWLAGIDFSEAMSERARGQARRLAPLAVEVRQEDFLATAVPDASADVAVSAFGLKTFSPEQQATASRELFRILKPGGRFSLVEISKPPARVLRGPYLLYLRRVIPLLGRAFLGNPDNYRLLGLYTEAFAPDHMARCLAEAGLAVAPRKLFFGCATLFVGTRPV